MQAAKDLRQVLRPFRPDVTMVDVGGNRRKQLREAENRAGHGLRQ